MIKLELVGIVAMTKERVIGRDGGLPWHLPEDLQFFKKTTLGHPIIMGRKTFDSIGRPLPKRRNIVMTRNTDWSTKGLETIQSRQDLDSMSFGDQTKLFIIGGAEIYKKFLPDLDSLLVTEVKENYTGNTFFPEFEHQFPEKTMIKENSKFTVYEYTR